VPILVPYAKTPPRTGLAVMPQLTLSRPGQSLGLTLADGWVVLPGVEGLDDPPRALVEVEPATWDGSMITGVRYTPREVFLPLHYQAPDPARLRTTLRTIAALLDPKRGPVTLEVAHTDGTRRFIDGHLSKPFGAALTSAEGSVWRALGLQLRCGDPYFYTTKQARTWTLTDPPAFLSATFLPAQLSDSQVTGGGILTNPGDADSHPTWTLTGPCDAATVTCGDDIAWTVPDGLLDTEELVLDTRRGTQTVTVNGAPAWGRLAPGARLGALHPGANMFTVEAVSATADTKVTASWSQRWLTAW